MEDKPRCFWTGDDDLMKNYHDNEWGDPVHDDRKLFEYMVLDAFQAGLSWKTILHKRENFRKAFHNFEPDIISEYDDEYVQTLLNDKGIVRNRSKINDNQVPIVSISQLTSFIHELPMNLQYFRVVKINKVSIQKQLNC